MGYRIGKIEKNALDFAFRYMFVISKEGDDFVLYSKQYNDIKQLEDFESLVRYFCLHNVIYIGSIDHAAGGEKTLGIWSGPRNHPSFQGANKDIIKCFEEILLEEFKKKICPSLEEVLNLCPL